MQIKWVGLYCTQSKTYKHNNKTAHAKITFKNNGASSQPPFTSHPSPLTPPPLSHSNLVASTHQDPVPHKSAALVGTTKCRGAAQHLMVYKRWRSKNARACWVEWLVVWRRWGVVLVGKVVFSRGWCSVHGVNGVYSGSGDRCGDNG